MADLSDRDVEDIIGGQQPVGRDDLANVVELTTWMHASRDLEPPPPMNDGLFWQVGDGVQAPTRSSRRPPAHLRAGSRRPSWARLVGGHPDGHGGVSLRPTLSLAAAAVLLVALLTAVYHGGSAQQPSTVASPPAAGETGQGRGSSVPTAAGGSTSTASTATTTSTTSSPASVATSTASGPGGVGSTTGPSDVNAAPSTDPKATDEVSGEGEPPAKGDQNDDGDGKRRDDGDRQASAESSWWTLDDLPWWPLVAEQSDEPDADTSEKYGEVTDGDGSGDGGRDEDAPVDERKAG
jgi:hypothetical protein